MLPQGLAKLYNVVAFLTKERDCPQESASAGLEQIGGRGHDTPVAQHKFHVLCFG